MRRVVFWVVTVMIAITSFGLGTTPVWADNGGSWYEVVEVDALPIRQCASRRCPLADPGRRVFNDPQHAFRQRILRGEWFKVYGEVKGECVGLGACTWYQVEENNYVYAGYTRVVPNPPYLKFTCSNGSKCIVVDRLHLRLYALAGNRIQRATYVSVGAKGKTPAGTYTISVKKPLGDMIGSPETTGWTYRLNEVPFQMTFWGLYKLHGTSTHSRFGTMAVSNGCINLTPADAAWLYRWAGVGTPVIISDTLEYLEPLPWPSGVPRAD